ncbi:hypothetical protein P3T36_004960 [Kitasatospora sp. MAP12-15]|uniref:hypothetical protein n=1 Tax=unclassified Kitasatospora TaxID=2633591 RepID=UPI0024771685|nr:hypothetical protein [Kitasatospora sp. MAP12-44]MDH6112063.1 hypothetical protein [Kitasatospora sp. MAP12-44]
MHAYLSSRFVKSIAVVAAALAVAGVTAGTAAADGHTNCTGQTVVDRPGEHAVKDAPAHHGDIMLGYEASITPPAVGQPWQFTLDEWNGTGADYQNVAVIPSFFGWTEVSQGRLGGMTPQNTHLTALVNGAWRNVPLQTGCDPAMSINSTLADHSLAAGARWRQSFRLTVDADVTPKLTSFQFTDAVIADGTFQYLKSDAASATIKVVRPAASTPATQRPTAPATRPTAPTVAAAPAASTAPVSATPAAAPKSVAPAAPATATPAASASAGSAALKQAPVAAVVPDSGPSDGSLLAGAGLVAALAGLVSLVMLRARRGRRA